jgi:3-oxoacyl-[acyl-carrier protein] reductase
MGSLAGRLACVTGSTKGVGRDIVLALAREGADVVVVGRDEAAASAVVQTASSLGVRAWSTKPDAFAGPCDPPLSTVDILVCSAGTTLPAAPLLSQDWNAYRRCFDLNLFGVMNAVQAVLPGMIAREDGRIIAIGGTFGYRGVATHALYSASKWALRGLMKSLAQEVGRHNVMVNIVAPGGIDGEKIRGEFAQEAAREGVPAAEIYQRFANRAATGRLVNGNDVAAAVVFLASPGGRLITGQDILVDGGTIV